MSAVEVAKVIAIAKLNYSYIELNQRFLTITKLANP